jgi:hypothetical protein
MTVSNQKAETRISLRKQSMPGRPDAHLFLAESSNWHLIGKICQIRDVLYANPREEVGYYRKSVSHRIF